MKLKAGTGLILICIVSLLLISAGFLPAQQELPGEKIFLRTDRDSYIAGEELFFKIYTIDPASQKPVHYSDIVYLEILDRQHSPLIRKKFALRRGESNGKIALPLEIKSEYYYLRAYTSWMKNAGASVYAYQLITVINPFEEIRPGMIKSEFDAEIENKQKSGFYSNPLGIPGMEIVVDTEHKTYGRRQKIMLEISTNDRSGSPIKASLMLSIVRKGLLNSTDQESMIYDGPQEASTDKIYPPEWAGHIICGNISRRSGEGMIRGDTLLFSVVGKRAMFDYCISDSFGNFRFLVNGMEGPQEIVIQNLNPSKTDYQIRLEDPFSSDYLEMQIPAFHIDTTKLEDINQAVITAQIKALYAKESASTDFDPIPLSFYGHPEKELILADYIKLPEMTEVFFELVPNAQIYGEGDQTTVRIRDKNTGLFFPSKPLMLVDGVVTREPLHISTLDPLKVKRIDLVNSGYYLGVLRFSGILSVFTEESRCPLTFPNYFLRQSYEFISPMATIKFPVYQTELMLDDRNRPDFRNTLYWNPDIRTNEKGRALIEFYTSDDVSDYILMIRGFTGDGLSGSYYDTLSVKNKGN